MTDKIAFLSIPPASSAYKAFTDKLLRELAEAAGLTYEQLTATYDSTARSRRLALSDLAFDPVSALNHLDKRGYAYRPSSGWCARPPLASLDMTSEDARAILYLHIVGNLLIPRGIGYTNLVDHAFELSPNRYVLTGEGGERKKEVVNKIAIKYEDPSAPKNGDLAPHSMETVEARRKAKEPECETLHESSTPDDGVIRLAKWPEGYCLWYHGECVWKSWEKVEDEPVEAEEAEFVPVFTPNDLDILTHALRLWKQAGEGLGIKIEQSYVDRLLNTALKYSRLA